MPVVEKSGGVTIKARQRHCMDISRRKSERPYTSLPKFKKSPILTLGQWIKLYREGITSPGLHNMHHYCKSWSKLLGQKILNGVTGAWLTSCSSEAVGRRQAINTNHQSLLLSSPQSFYLAIAEGHLTNNPVKGVKFFFWAIRTFSFSFRCGNRAASRGNASDDWTIVAFALETGPRLSEQSEQFNARWDCVDTEVGVLTVPLSKSVKQDRLFELGVYQNRTRPVIVADKVRSFSQAHKIQAERCKGGIL